MASHEFYCRAETCRRIGGFPGSVYSGDSQLERGANYLARESQTLAARATHTGRNVATFLIARASVEHYAGPRIR